MPVPAKLYRQAAPADRPAEDARAGPAEPQRATSARSTSACPRSWPCSKPSAACCARTPSASTAARSASTSRASSSCCRAGRPAAAPRTACSATTPCPRVTGRVCPQETQCESRVHPRQEGRAGGHRLPRTLSSADWARAQQRPAAPQLAPAQRQEGGRGRLRPGRPDRRGRAGQARPRGHRLRGPAHSRAACWSTASPSSACPRRSSQEEVDAPASGWA